MAGENNEESTGGFDINNYINSALNAKYGRDVSPQDIDPQFSQEDFLRYQQTTGAGNTVNYNDLIFPSGTLNRPLKVGDYQGQIVGNVPIFTPQPFIFPGAALQYKRDQLRAAAAARARNMAKKVDYKIPFSVVPMYNDKVRGIFMNFIEEAERRAESMTDEYTFGWDRMQNGQGENGRWYRNGIAFFDNMVRKIDYVASMAVKADELRQRGAYLGVDANKTISDVLNYTEDAENLIFDGNESMSELLQRMDTEVNYLDYAYKAIDQLQAEVNQHFNEAPEYKNAGKYDAFVQHYFENVDPARISTVAKGIAMAYPNIVGEGKQITTEELEKQIGAYIGYKKIESLETVGLPQGNNITVNTVESKDISAVIPYLMSDIQRLSDGKEIRIGNNSIYPKNGVLEVTIGNNRYDINANDKFAVLKAVMEVNATQSWAAGFGTEYNTANVWSLFNNANYADVKANLNNASFGDPQAVLQAIETNTNGKTNPVDIINGTTSGYKNSFRLANSNMFRFEAASGSAEEFEFKMTVGENAGQSGVFMLASAAPAKLRTAGNGVMSTNDVSVESGNIQYYSDGTYIFFPGYKYKDAGNGYYELVDSEGDHLEFPNSGGNAKVAKTLVTDAIGGSVNNLKATLKKQPEDVKTQQQDIRPSVTGKYDFTLISKSDSYMEFKNAVTSAASDLFSLGGDNEAAYGVGVLQYLESQTNDANAKKYLDYIKENGEAGLTTIAIKLGKSNPQLIDELTRMGYSSNLTTRQMWNKINSYYNQ